MRTTFNPAIPALPDVRLQTLEGRGTAAVQSVRSVTSGPSQNLSTKHLKDFALAASTNLKANALLNSDDNGTPIHQKDPGAILKSIDDNIETTAKAWGWPKHDVEQMLGSSKRFNEPVCGVSANNIMKLFLDSDDHSFDFQNGQSLTLAELHHRLEDLPVGKNYILRVNDSVMGHAYVIDIPAGSKPDRDAFLYQSDLGDGATRTLRLDDWMSKRASHPIPLMEIRTHFNNMASGVANAEHLARLFDIDNNASLIRTERLNLGTPAAFNFQLREYDTANLERNLTQIRSSIA